MSANTPGNHHDQQNFALWEGLRQASEPYYSAIYPQLAPHLQDAERILDIGGGDGHSHRVLPEFSLGMTTLDADEAALARLRTAMPGVETVKAMAQRMPFE